MLDDSTAEKNRHREAGSSPTTRQTLGCSHRAAAAPQTRSEECCVVVRVLFVSGLAAREGPHCVSAAPPKECVCRATVPVAMRAACWSLEGTLRTAAPEGRHYVAAALPQECEDCGCRATVLVAMRAACGCPDAMLRTAARDGRHCVSAALPKEVATGGACWCLEAMLRTAQRAPQNRQMPSPTGAYHGCHRRAQALQLVDQRPTWRLSMETKQLCEIPVVASTPVPATSEHLLRGRTNRLPRTRPGHLATVPSSRPRLCLGHRDVASAHRATVWAMVRRGARQHHENSSSRVAEKPQPEWDGLWFVEATTLERDRGDATTLECDRGDATTLERVDRHDATTLKRVDRHDEATQERVGRLDETTLEHLDRHDETTLESVHRPFVAGMEGTNHARHSPCRGVVRLAKPQVQLT
mmetsp:Transcript_29812/g.79257  ORF Transcript_29812/g.79257 Transcript_29812/m.79257 type:complete len:412 (+) Transcript_29812:611-1846(+)